MFKVDAVCSVRGSRTKTSFKGGRRKINLISFECNRSTSGWQIFSYELQL